MIPGGSGQVGTLTARAFQAEGHEVVVLSRTPSRAPWRTVRWDAATLGEWAAEVAGADVVLNLAGRSVNCRYNARNRKLILDSRVLSTAVVGQAIARAKRPPALWLQASTATIYAHRYDAPNDEATGILGGDEPDAPDTPSRAGPLAGERLRLQFSHLARGSGRSLPSLADGEGPGCPRAMNLPKDSILFVAVVGLRPDGRPPLCLLELRDEGAPPAAPASGVRTMLEINVTIVNLLFLAIFLGIALATAILAITAPLRLSTPGMPLLLAGPVLGAGRSTLRRRQESFMPRQAGRETRQTLSAGRRPRRQPSWPKVQGG